MAEKLYGSEMCAAFSYLVDAGFTYDYLYDKGSDSSCVYIRRFSRGREFIDFRETSGGGESIVVSTAAGYVFPDLKRSQKALYRAFRRKHFFRKPTSEEKYLFYSVALHAEIREGTLYGMKL